MKWITHQQQSGQQGNALILVLIFSVIALASLAEGFTLVTLEAMSYGVPVVATDTTSIAEGTGDAAELAPLDEPEAFAACLRTALTPGPRRDQMRAKGFERIKFPLAIACMVGSSSSSGKNSSNNFALYGTEPKPPPT